MKDVTPENGAQNEAPPTPPSTLGEAPKWVIGQVVSGDDYAQLPVGSVVTTEFATIAARLTKSGADEWDGGTVPHRDAWMSATGPRRLAHVGDPADAATERCTGEGACKAAVHYHGCYADVPTATCDDPAAHYSAARLAAGHALDALNRFQVETSAEKLAKVQQALDEIVLAAETVADHATEPAPLKEGDAVLVWAKVISPEPDSDGDIKVRTRATPGSTTAWTSPDDIVRPAEGQTPPWVKAERCTSLYEHVGSLHRCDLDAGHEDHPGHSNVNVGWTTADEAGRITEAAS